MLLLRNPIQPYAWGPIDGIARLVGSAPTGDHEAELWVGTHPRGPSVVAEGEHEGVALAEVIAADPVRWLGPDLAATGATALPFLLKVLAISTPLSLQAHPSADQARAGFDREEVAGIAADSPERLYADPFPKPELLVAIDRTHALSGFRPSGEAADLVAALGEPALDPLVALLRAASPSTWRGAISWLLQLQGPERQVVAEAVQRGAARSAGDAHPESSDVDPAAWVLRLAVEHPGDPTCLAPLLLHLRVLDGVGSAAAIALDAGNLHAYLHGAGIEIMAASDNVLRGGLTPKHVDTEELLRVLVFDEAASGLTVRPGRNGAGAAAEAVLVFDAAQEPFGLVRVDPAATPGGDDDGGRAPIEVDATAPSLLLAVGGPVVLVHDGQEVVLDHGLAAFLPPGASVTVARGTGVLWWATTRAGLPVT